MAKASSWKRLKQAGQVLETLPFTLGKKVLYSLDTLSITLKQTLVQQHSPRPWYNVDVVSGS